MAEPLWTSKDVAAAVGGEAYGPPFAATGVAIDTRLLEPGELFFALPGARDGEDFLKAAFDRGASGAVTRNPHPVPGVRVEDPQRALEALGAAARRRATDVRVAGVTGSVGKTSVTQALAAALRATGPTHASIKSYNNHIGVPLTLARMPAASRYGVFEIGMNHAEEIRPLARLVRPDVCVVTTVGSAHVENFADGEAGVARAKAEIFDGAGSSGVAVLNADNRHTEALAAAAAARGLSIVTFGQSEAARARLLRLEPREGGSLIEARIGALEARLELKTPGLHSALNVLAVLLAVEALGASLEGAISALEAFSPLAGRGESVTLALPGGEARLIDESYNANPVSMAAALALLGEARPVGRRIAVLTDMLELGAAGPEAHLALRGPLDAAKVDLVFAAGPLTAPLFDGLEPHRRGGWAPAAEGLEPLLLTALRPGDVVMVKGSNGSQAHRLAGALRAAFGGSR